MGAHPSFSIVAQPDHATVDAPPVLASSKFTIAFAPVAPATGTQSATVQIASNDPANPSYSFTISGTVKPAGTLSPPSGLHVRPGVSNVYFGEAPFALNLSATGVSAAANLKWDITDASVAGDPYETTTGTAVADLTQTLRFEAPESRTIHFKTVAADGTTEGDVTTMTIVAYPNEKNAFPRYSGLPFDNNPPFIDGVLSGPDAHVDATVSGIDVKYGENGYRGAYSLPFSDGTAPDARIDLVRGSDALYIGVDVNFDDTLTDSDKIYIGIGVNENARFNEYDSATSTSNVGLLTITPNTNTVTLSQKNASGGWDPVATVPAAMEKNHVPSIDSDAAHWSFELKLPIGTGADMPPWLNLGNTFLFFARVARYNDASANYINYSWPKGIPATVDHPELDSEWWGVANRNDSLPSNGLYIADCSSIGVALDPNNLSAPLTNVISFTNPASGANTIVNRLVARVSNDAQRATLASDGTVNHEYIVAPGVRVTFKIANWGVPSPDAQYWTKIAADAIPTDATKKTDNPTNPRDTVPARTATGPGTKEFYLDWKLNDAQITAYNSTAIAVSGLETSHQCVLAEIDTNHTNPASAPADAVSVVSKSMWNNMDFSAVNPGGEGFSAPAEISAQGLDSFIADLKLKHSDERRILLRVFPKEWESSKKMLASIDKKRVAAERLALTRDTLVAVPAKKPILAERYLPELHGYIEEAPKAVYFMEYIVKAYVFTGRTTKVKGRTYEELASIGSYGYVVRHESPTEGWDFRIEGAQKIDDRTYLITIKKGGKATIKDYVGAIEPPHWSFGALGGMGWGVPRAGDFTPMGGGGMGMAMFSLEPDEKGQIVSLQATGGYDYFPASGASEAWKTGSLSLAARFSLPLLFDWSRWYCAMGGGLFQDDSSAIKIGWVIGMGLDIAVSHPIHLELGADALINKTEGGLLHLNAGLVYRLIR